MNKKAMMRTKPRYSFKELHKMHQKALSLQHISYNFKNAQGEVRSTLMNEPLMKSYQEHPDVLKHAQNSVRGHYDTNVFGSDYILGYNIALEEESLDQDIVDVTEDRIQSLTKVMNIVGIIFSTLLPTVIALIAAYVVTSLDNVGLVIGLGLIIIFNTIMLLVIRPKLFKSGIRDGATFSGKFSKKAQTLFNMGLTLGSLSIGFALAIMIQNLLTVDMFSMNPLYLAAMIGMSYIFFYFISKIKVIKKQHLFVLAALISSALAFII